MWYNLPEDPALQLIALTGYRETASAEEQFGTFASEQAGDNDGKQPQVETAPGLHVVRDVPNQLRDI